ncbi:hypothetical protein R84981_002841 [Carnimonas sp. R-84981]|uniref:DUF968 domain-containing protein n=1 Tax=Carnimonas bestiolae TaxID=3402172 RepID=UPI003EDBE9A6
MSKKNPKYLRWVRTQPCCMCGAPADHAHHIISRGNVSGMGMKPADVLTVPVCAPHHNEIHRDPDLWDDQYMWLVQTINRAAQEGIL